MCKEKKKHNLELWAAIASSIAAVAGIFLLIYQLHSDNPNLNIKLNGAAFADYENELYLATWVSAFNNGKRPVGILKSKLNISYPDGTKISLDETPVFPRFSTANESNAPGIETPFFYDPSYYDNFIKDKSGKPIPFDYHPHELQYIHKIFNTGTYHAGYIIFKLDNQNREKFIKFSEKTTIRLIFDTTDKQRNVSIVKINKWKKETFGKRFLIIKP